MKPRRTALTLAIADGLLESPAPAQENRNAS
jgi:hypothetical protein